MEKNAETDWSFTEVVGTGINGFGRNGRPVACIINCGTTSFFFFTENEIKSIANNNYISWYGVYSAEELFLCPRVSRPSIPTIR